MSYQLFSRVPVPPPAAQKLETITLPAPTRGLVLDENETFTQPGSAIVMDNWKPTLRGVSLRGGCVRWSVLPETTPVISGFQYIHGSNQRMFAGNATKLYDITAGGPPTLVKSGQTSGNYVASQLANQGGDWLLVLNDAGDFPLRYNGSSWTTLNGTAPPTWTISTAYTVGTRAMDIADRSYWKCAVAHTSAATGTFSADRIAHPTFWTPDLAADGSSWITGPAGSNVVSGRNLTYVCKYRSRYFFIEASSMNAWYLPVNAVGGVLSMIPLSGAATKGGELLFCAVWSLDAGDGTDDKLVFVTNQGEILVFTGSDPSTLDNWRQEGRFQSAQPLGMNAHMPIGGDLLIAGVDGIVPISAAITKSREELELAAISRRIRPLWRDEVNAKRGWAWTMCNWEEYGGVFVSTPGSSPGYCLAVNGATGAWCRFVGYDATCFMRLRADMFFGTQNGLIMQADRTGYDDGRPYTAVLVGGWEMFQSPSQTITWRQARASFSSVPGQPFQPQLNATVDYVVNLPPAPPAGIDPGVVDAWDQGSWGPDMGGPPPPVPTAPQRAQYAQWDQPVAGQPVVRNTLWVSIGMTGYSHAPIVQITVAQKAKPDVNLISIAATFERAGINV